MPPSERAGHREPRGSRERAGHRAPRGSREPRGHREPRAELLRAATDYVAQHGFGQASLRQIATGIGSSHRMLIYHFGSKRGLASAIIEAIQQSQLQALHDLLQAEDVRPADAAERFWELVTDNAMTFGPLFFELAANAMRGHDREPMTILGVHMWLDPLAELWRSGGADPERAPMLARMSLAMANGLLLDALLTGDMDAAQATMRAFTAHFADQLSG